MSVQIYENLGCYKQPPQRWHNFETMHDNLSFFDEFFIENTDKMTYPSHWHKS